MLWVASNSAVFHVVVQRNWCWEVAEGIRKSGRCFVGSIPKFRTIEKANGNKQQKHPIAIQFPAKQSQIRNHWSKKLKHENRLFTKRNKLSGSEFLFFTYTWDIGAVDDLHVRNEAVRQASWVDHLSRLKHLGFVISSNHLAVTTYFDMKNKK